MPGSRLFVPSPGGENVTIRHPTLAHPGRLIISALRRLFSAGCITTDLDCPYMSTIGTSARRPQ
ncbi:MAG: hypothetical protein WC406_06945 [Methanoregula sp.]|nr:hypothetical protein [Methanoregula sp.]